MTSAAARRTEPRTPWYRSTWLRPFNDPVAIDELLQRVRPRSALRQVRVQVLQVIEQTADTRSFVLRANRHWRGFKAGQHVLLSLEVRGRKLSRCFSLSSAPAGRVFEVTVKRQAEGGVSDWMHRELRVGSVLQCSQAQGQFTLAEPFPERLLLLSAGSGITPVMAILRDLLARNASCDVVFVHSCRQPDELIFGAELRRLAARHPQLRLIVQHSVTEGRLDATRLAAQVPDFAERRAMVCGPNAFAGWVRQLYQDHGVAGLLQSESFGLAAPLPLDSMLQTQSVTVTKSEQTFTASPGQSLLLAAESAGLNPQHGCRIGICRSCQCRKRSGRVQNLLTGEICDEPDQLIQLCISTAHSPITLDL